LQLVRQPACTARTWHPETPDGLSLAPRNGFWPLRINAPNTVNHSLVKPALRNGLSLPWGGCLFRNHLSRIVAPGLPLQHHIRTGFEPVRLQTPFLAIRFRMRESSTPATRCPRHLFGAPGGFSSLAPRQEFRSLRLDARPDSPLENLPPRSTDLRSLPASASF
jgi:hypothetical protein